MNKKTNGFTLIELSIVLVIIGLIVGGILTGQDLISAATSRAQISQIEKYNTAVHTFQSKYNGQLPGDIQDPAATGFGFISRGPEPGMGDGDGLITGTVGNLASPLCQTRGETGYFWSDLARAHLIERSFEAVQPGGADNVSMLPSDYFPAAKIGRNAYVYIFGDVNNDLGGGQVNYYNVAVISSLAVGGVYPVAAPAMTVAEAYNIDTKMDDGLPQSGNVKAIYLDYNPPWGPPDAIHWASGAVGVADGASTGSPNYGPTTASTPGSTTTCYDNGSSSNAQQYSMGQSNGSGINCALTFKFQ